MLMKPSFFKICIAQSMDPLYLAPPPEVMQQESNWPLLTVSKSLFDAMAASKGSKGAAAAAAMEVEDVEGGAGGDGAR